MGPATLTIAVFDPGAAVTGALAVVEVRVANIDGTGVTVIAGHVFTIDAVDDIVTNLLAIAVETIVAILVEGGVQNHVQFFVAEVDRAGNKV